LYLKMCIYNYFVGRDKNSSATITWTINPLFYTKFYHV